MKTRLSADLIEPKILVDVISSGSSLHFTYSDGSSEDINLLTIGQAVLAAAVADAQAKVNLATNSFVAANPTVPKEGAIQTTGIAAFVYNNTSYLQVT
jgi:hypothetical protein